MMQENERYIIDGTFDNVFDCMELAVNEASLGSINVDRAQGIITISTKISWKSWGEDMTITMAPLSKTQTEVILASGVKFQLIDWGKNKANIQKIKDAFTLHWESFRNR